MFARHIGITFVTLQSPYSSKKEKNREVASTENSSAHKSAAQLLTKLAAEPEGYAECYPGLDEMQDAIEDSDDEVKLYIAIQNKIYPTLNVK